MVGSGSGGGRALRITWAVAGVIGVQAIGPATVSTSPATGINFLGSLTATVSGDRVTLTLNAQTDPSRCRVQGTGAGTVAGTAINGTLDVTFSGCEGLDLQPPAGNQLTLTKQ